jgi:ABC-type transport system involved in Fe-S cluster assembly fused permease/ATPase subunit
MAVGHFLGEVEMMRSNLFQKSIHYGTRKSVIHTAIITAMIVGTILNLINQFPNLLRGKPLSPVKIFLNYLTPYMVATVGAIRMCFQFESKMQNGSDPTSTSGLEQCSSLSSKKDPTDR